ALGFAHVGHDLPYSDVGSILQIELSPVEKWAIYVICTGLLTGKLSQTTKSLHVYHLSARMFEREQWEASCLKSCSRSRRRVRASRLTPCSLHQGSSGQRIKVMVVDCNMRKSW
ncbi:hypothetical protein BDR06DRAFT_884710, partial [Suillus hirtellus]